MSYLSASGPDAPQTLSVPQLHLNAAEFLERASRLHKEAAQLHAAGEHRAAALQVLMARYLVAKVAAHMAEAGKNVRPAQVPSSYAAPGSAWQPVVYGRSFDGNAAKDSAPASSMAATVSRTAA